MSISYQILGGPGGDNAAVVRIDSGQSLDRLLFDCGAGCLWSLTLSEVQAIDALLFSHLHMDHIGGFDTFFRATYSRVTKPNRIWGPPGTAAILHHRFQGFLWNLQEGQPGGWEVFDIEPTRCVGARFELGEAFARRHELGERARDPYVIDAPTFTVAALQMDHRTPSMAYVVREKDRVRVDTEQLMALRLPPGPWLQEIKSPRPNEPTDIRIAGTVYERGELRKRLLVTNQSDSFAYLTDFLLDDAAQTKLVPALQGCTTVVCESQYLHEDRELAWRNYHMTVTQVAELARQAQVGTLVLFHVSDRYRAPELRIMLEQARAIFPNTYFPAHWKLGE